MDDTVHDNLEESQGLDAPGYEAMEEDELNLPDHCFGCARREELNWLVRNLNWLVRK